MKNVHSVLLNALFFVYSAQMVAYQIGWALLLPIAVLACTTQLPSLSSRWKESMMIFLPLFVSVAGLTLGLLMHFPIKDHRVEIYAHCILASVISYLVSVGLIVLRRAYRRLEARQYKVNKQFERWNKVA